MEMRKETRYRLDAPALFSWESGYDKRVHGEGVTRDISVLGVFILTATCPPLDVPIQVEVVLPSLTGMKPVIRIRGSARVLRVENITDGKMENGFAVVSENFSQWSIAKYKKESTSVSGRPFAALGVLAGSGQRSSVEIFSDRSILAEMLASEMAAASI